MRPVAAAIGSGSLTSLAFAVARELLWNDNLPPLPPLPTLPGVTELCPVLEGWVLDSHSFCIGVLVGILLLLCLDLLILIRLAWGRILEQHLRGGSQGQERHSWASSSRFAAWKARSVATLVVRG